MRITTKTLSIPPYISTSWSQIHVLYMQEKNLIIKLADATTISIPDLEIHDIKAIFAAHSAFTENFLSNAPPQEHAPMQFLRNSSNSSMTSLPSSQMPEGLAAMQFNIDGMESFSTTMHHNPEQAHMPNLPAEILKKIAAIANILEPGDIQNMPKPEPHCNCPHCQISRAIRGQTAETKTEESSLILEPQPEEIVNEQDLSFQQWEIAQTGDKLYTVANRLDLLEKYRVFLGEPVGCTCGISGCEHILAVLKS